MKSESKDTKEEEYRKFIRDFLLGQPQKHGF